MNLALIRCKNCKNILLNNQHIKFYSIIQEIIKIDVLPTSINRNSCNKISSLEDYDKYCVYFEINCNICFLIVGKEYITFNPFLIENSIKFSIQTKYIEHKDYIIEEKSNMKNSDTEGILNPIENIGFSKLYIIDFSSNFFIFEKFFHLYYKIHKKNMKKMLSRIQLMEEKINILILFLAKLNNSKI